MLADAHRQAAEDIEHAISDMGDPASKPYLGRSIIELYWGAAFHWVAYGCQQKHDKHKENHTKLGKFLRDIGEDTVSHWWDTLDEQRRGGWYGHQNTPTNIQQAQDLWQEIRTWAMS